VTVVAAYTETTAPAVDSYYRYLRDPTMHSLGVLIGVEQLTSHGGDSWDVNQASWKFLDPKLKVGHSELEAIFGRAVPADEWHQMLDKGQLKPATKLHIEYIPGLPVAAYTYLWEEGWWQFVPPPLLNL
jgi:hypothetical protein